MRFPPSLRKWRNKQKNADCRVASLLAMTVEDGNALQINKPACHCEASQKPWQSVFFAALGRKVHFR